MQLAGYNGGEEETAVTLLVCDGNAFRLSVARAIAAALSESDLNVILEVLSYENYLAALARGDFDFYFGEVRMTPDFNCSALVQTGGSLNYGGYSNVVMDTFLTSAYSSAISPAGSNSALLKLIQQEATIVPICFKSQSLVLQGGAADGMTPTASNAFYQFTDWQIHIKGENSNG